MPTAATRTSLSVLWKAGSSRKNIEARASAGSFCPLLKNGLAATGAREMASDTQIDNALSQQVHEALGFQVVDRCVHYRKPL
jgi:hypothetical protein